MRQMLYVHRLPGRLRLEVPALKHKIILSGQVADSLQQMAGVRRCVANPLTGKVLIIFDEQQIRYADIILAIDSLLPKVLTEPAGQSPPLIVQKRAGSLICGRPLLNLALCGAAAAALLLSRRNAHAFASSQLLRNSAAVATVATTYPLFSRGLRRFLESKHLNYDLLTGAVVFSLLVMRKNVLGLAISALVNTTELIRQYNLNSVRLRIREMSALIPQTAWLVLHEREEAVAVHLLREGDIVAVHAGEVIPVDGLIIDGKAVIDASRITGSPYPTMMQVGDEVLAGCQISEGAAQIEVQRVGSATFLAQMASEVSSKLDRRHNEKGIEQILSFTVLLAAASYLFTGNLNRSIAILLAAAPTVLDLAMPTAYMPFIVQAMEEGIYFRDEETIAAIAEANTVVFDKTGTLTIPQSEICEIELIDPEYTREKLLQLAALAEQGVRHPVALAIRKEAAQVKTGPAMLAKKIAYSPGLGVQATVRGQQILIGNMRLMEQERIDLSESRGRARRLCHMGLIPVYIAVDGQIRGIFGVRDVMKKESLEAINQLRLAGIREFSIISGDRQENTAQLASELEISVSLGSLLPEEKASFIKQMKQERRRKVVMVGDGVNDSLAMTASDVGVALGCVAIPSAACAGSIIIASEDPRKVARALRLARSAREMARQSTALATALSVAGLSLGTVGLLTPATAGILANVGVLAVIANPAAYALRHRYRRSRLNKNMMAEIACTLSEDLQELPAWHTVKGVRVLELLRSPHSGLSAAERALRLEMHGKNILQIDRKTSLWALFLQPFRDFMVRLLLGASIASVLVGEVADALIIGGIILLEASLGVIQGYRAEKSLKALREMSAPGAVVLEDGCYKTIQAIDLVPGDIIMLEAGDQVPADARLLEAVDFEVEEASLTGEAEPVRKEPHAASQFASIPAERLNMVFMGTSVSRGRAKAVVVATGMNTQMGQVAKMLQEAEDELTPLQIQLDTLGKKITVGCVAACGLVVAIGLLRGRPFLEMIRTGVSLAVGAIPEGLPAVVTIAMAFGVHRMVKKNTVVRKLSAVETLGSTTVICADKTGTLTKNEMTVTNIAGYGRHWHVSGEGYLPDGQICSLGGVVDLAEDEALRKILSIATLCNNADYDAENASIQGDPTEAALLVVAAKAGFPWSENREVFCREKEFAFDSNRKLMSVICRDTQGTATLYAKGAPGSILGSCTHLYNNGEVSCLGEKEREEIQLVTNLLAGRALRVLAMAYRPLSAEDDAIDSSAEKDLIFAGLVGMADPPKPGVREAVDKCRRAGVKVIMITGDHSATAMAIAEQLGILHQGSMLSGREIEIMSEDALCDCIEEIEVCARTTPEHKLRIVRALKRKGHVVAMTGDGVNDAPAVKEADVGIAMGLNGTEVTKGAASLVLTDDNFVTIVAALEEGRAVGDNIRDTIRYILPGNLGVILTIIGSSLTGLPLPLIPSQILFVNLITESIPALALGAKPPARGVLDQPPRKPGNSIISNGLQNRILVRGILTGLTSFALFRLAGSDIARARTMAFANLVTSQVFNLLKCQSGNSEKNPYLLPTAGASLALTLATMYLPFIRPLFQTIPLGVKDWAMLTAVSLLINKAEDIWAFIEQPGMATQSGLQIKNPTLI